MLDVLYSLNKQGKLLSWEIQTFEDEIHITSGQLYGKKTTRITKAKPKNIGRANETTAPQQAEKEALAKWKKQLETGYFKTVEEAENTVVQLPMLAESYLERGHSIVCPCYVSKKLDGVRCVVFIEGTSVKMVTRKGKIYRVPHIEQQLLRLSDATGIKVFDGEIYIHGMMLNQINSLVKKHKPESENLEFHIFDLPSDQPFEQRNAEMLKLGIALEMDESLTHLHMVDQFLVEDMGEARKIMLKYLLQGYEGLMLRNVFGMYEWNNRSTDLQKWKDFKDFEAKVIGVSEDLLGEGVLLCESPHCTAQFECKMKGNHAYRSYSNMLGLVGKWINVKYQTLTEYGAPQFPVGMYVRDCDKNGCPLI